METNQDINIKALIKDGLSEKSIVRRLVQNGVSEQEATEQYYLASDAIQDEYTIRYRLLWIVILALALASAFVILPLSLSGKNPITFAILFSVLIAVAFIQTIEVFDSFSSFWSTFVHSDHHRKPKIPIVIIPFIPIIFSFGLGFYYKWELNHELEVNGVDMFAKIEEVERLTPVNDSNEVSGPISHRILITFTPKGKDETEQIEHYCFVSDLQFENAHIGNAVPVRYSARYPEFFTVDLKSLDESTAPSTLELIEDDGKM